MVLPYRLPDFNVTANIWRSTTPTTDPPDVVSDAQLYLTSKVFVATSLLVPGDAVPTVTLRVPMGTDLQKTDVVECDAGDGHFYTCTWVERMHLGFANEYLIGLLEQGTVAPPSGDGILLEAGDFVLTEAGDHILLE